MSRMLKQTCFLIINASFYSGQIFKNNLNPLKRNTNKGNRTAENTREQHAIEEGRVEGGCKWTSWFHHFGRGLGLMMMS